METVGTLKLPGRLYEIQETGMIEVKFEETEHYRITKSFLENPQQYLRYL
jgi:predicted ATPase